MTIDQEIDTIRVELERIEQLAHSLEWAATASEEQIAAQGFDREVYIRVLSTARDRVNQAMSNLNSMLWNRLQQCQNS